MPPGTSEQQPGPAQLPPVPPWPPAHPHISAYGPPAPAYGPPAPAYGPPAPAYGPPAPRFTPQPPGHLPQSPAFLPPQPAEPRSRGRVVLVIVLLVAGLASAGGGAALLGLEMTRHATTTEATAAGQQAVATLWERLTAGQIFPRQLPYASPIGSGTARLVGIAPSSSCTAATDPGVATVLGSSGCTAMLRATYTDPTGTVVATIGIAVFGSTHAAAGASSAIAGYMTPGSAPEGLRAVSFPGTPAANFTDDARANFGAKPHGQYLVMYAAGYADGRKTTPDYTDAPLYLATSVQQAVSKIFTAPAKPCQSRYIAC